MSEEIYNQSFMRCPNCRERYNTQITHECESVRIIPLSFEEYNRITKAQNWVDAAERGESAEAPQFGTDSEPDKGWSIRTSEFRDGVLINDSFDMMVDWSYAVFSDEARRVANEFIKPSDEMGFFQFASKVWFNLSRPTAVGTFTIPDPFVTLNDDGTIQTVTYLIEGK